MRQITNLTRNRAVPILTGAVVAILVVPATALAGEFAGPHSVYHQAATTSGGSGGSGGLVIFLGVIALIAVAVSSVAILSRAGTERKSARRPAPSTRRKPAGIAS